MSKHQTPPIFQLEALEPRVMLSAEGAALLNPASAVFVETLPQDLPDHFDDLAQPDVLDTEALFQTTYEAEPAVIPASSDPISLKSAQTFQETTILEGDSHFFEDTFRLPDLGGDFGGISGK